MPRPNPTQAVGEGFRPVSVLAPNSPFRKLIWGIRLCVDFQLASVLKDLRPFLRNASGRVVDIGCGDMPFRPLMQSDRVEYIGFDIVEADQGFGYRNPEVKQFDGLHLPVEPSSVDWVICTEVLEHHPDPQALIQEIYRVLKTGGTLLLTVPWSARVHYAPYDFCRFTSYQLTKMTTLFADSQISARGSDITAICNKLIVLVVRCAKRSLKLNILSLIALIFLAPWVPLMILFGQISLTGRIGSKDDPLGYTVVATK